MTVPALDWVAKDATSYSYPRSIYPDQQAFDPFNSDAGNGRFPNGSALTPHTDPTLAYTPWNTSLAEQWLSGLTNIPTILALDNEIEIADHTHQDMHPEPVGYDEELERMIAFARASKAALPDVAVAAPMTCSWWFYWTSALGWADTTAHWNTDFLPWFLQEMKKAETTYGKRLLDYLDIHYYFQPDTSAEDAAAKALRLRMTRSLWDKSYVDESWIGADPQNHQWEPDRVQLVPRFRTLIDIHYPGTKLAISEWSSTNDNDITGGLVTADSLGIFGKYKVDAATYWYQPDEMGPVGLAFWLYRGYGVFFGSNSAQVNLASPNPDTYGIYAATENNKLSLVIVNKDTKPLAFDLSNVPFGTYFLRHFGGASGVAKWQTTIEIKANNYIVVPSYTAISGSVLWSTTNYDGTEKLDLLKSGPIRCAALSSSGKYLATAGDDKLLKVWELEGLKLLNHRELPKRPTNMLFTESDDILVSDKFGDIFRYTLHPRTDLPKVSKDALSSHENPSGGDLILGHTSFLTAFTLSHDRQYIITADRDEHVRVSWYPKGFNIEMYCLGHEKFVSALHIPEFEEATLVSGGGDPVLKVWDWMSGRFQRDINILDAVAPYIKVKPQGKPSGEDGEGIDGDIPGGKKARRKKGKKQKGKQTADDAAGTEDGPVDPAVQPPVVQPPILVIQKIDSLDSNGLKYLLFSAVGATALFSVNFSRVEGIQALDVGRPILDFTLQSDGLCAICVDGNWGDARYQSSALRAYPRLTPFPKFSLIDDESSVIKSLNTLCLVPASDEDLKSLDLYLPLTALPKNSDTEYNGMDREVTDIIETPEDGGAAVAGRKIGKKQMGRLKNKQNLMEKVRMVEASGPPSDAQSEVAGRDVADAAQEPEPKKLRSSSPQPQSNFEDVAMSEG
ncbi:hypothetical protein ONZ45_g14363 [Pleurotus djamor]|nr:hypothetical protein ONZ45_g14363 [Pleurotus djamor]